LQGAFNLLRGLFLTLADLLVIGQNFLRALILRAQQFNRRARGFLIFPQLAVFYPQRLLLLNQFADFFFNIIDFIHALMIQQQDAMTNGLSIRVAGGRRVGWPERR